MAAERKTRIESCGRELLQVKFYDRQVLCWVDYGDPVKLSEVDEKAARCRRGETP